MITKTFQELTLADDFLFGEVMRHEEVCKKFLEALLGKPIRRIHYIERQFDLTDGYYSHGIRLDVYLDDEAGTIYNVEMQNKPDELPFRSRYYQSGIDRHTLEKGEGYESLKESYIIFVCNYDHFNRGLAVYEKVSTIRGCEGIVYDDGSHVFILNSRYTTKNCAEPISQFLDCIRDGKFAENYAEGSLMSEVVEAVNLVKSNSEKEGMYMTYAMKLADERRIGRAEGRAEGRVEERAASLMHIMEGLSLTREQAAKLLKIPEDEWEKYFELIGN